MRFSSQDPDIETIVRRIEDGDYDLQPDFQRGEVWSTQKKRRLIDSILRGWHVPPIHLVARDDGRSDVLDGQQRLTAIRDFVNGAYAIDGRIEPFNASISALHGARYAELPPDAKRAFRKFTIRVFELLDYTPDEPHELFFRLNQPTSLTEAEKRNAFIGDARNQVRDLVNWVSHTPDWQDSLGFSNARMAYDDVLARVLVTVEARRLDEKITAARVTARYRAGEPFAEADVRAVRGAVKVVFDALAERRTQHIRPNKATLHTWLCIASQILLGEHQSPALDRLPATIHGIEIARWMRPGEIEGPAANLFALFQDRATARVADVSSVLLRDLIGWMFLAGSDSESSSNVKLSTASRVWNAYLQSTGDLDDILNLADAHHWGDLGW
ncbi:DUF262 domain-containing protein [Agrococcus sp. HG114]|uniref:DUF262 domain-containing protein n=1 Tax=Agrococcus sp. HG114 TaxID=2969757 RepID=UPI00215ABA8C|nr:DUF262 domain-containing protein [Agrococcus sp. HG114]MCR8670793.1 DUF262 domain-containing protein [Agrococcus sp. HG114]